MSGRASLKEQHINVYVRIRPDTAQERKRPPLLAVRSQREIHVKHSTFADKKYVFDRVFDEMSTQADIFDTIVRPLVPEVIGGYNCTVFAYGQTGTGKTYTMTGDTGDSEGVIPRTLNLIFDSLCVLNTESSVRVSYIELYNEEVFDMLSAADIPIRIYEDKNQKGSVILQGVEEYTLNDKKQLYQILEMGNERRRTATTLMNAHSSRSHTVFTIIVHTRETTADGEELVKTGKINLVDLAGSENILRSGAVEKRAREAGNINQSLLTLGRVIKALTEKNTHVPYRESKLTRILQDSLGGRTKTSLIATISSSTLNTEETLSTLEYAMRARSIQNHPEVNQKISRTALIKKYSDEIERLKRDLAAARTGNGIYLDEENYNNILANNEIQRNELMNKMDMIRNLQSEIDDKNNMMQHLKESFQKSIITLKEESEKSRYYENKTKKLFQNEETLHNKLSALYQASENNRTISKRFCDMYMKLYFELKENLDSSVALVMESAVRTCKDVKAFEAKLEESYRVLKVNLDEFNALCVLISQYRDIQLEAKAKRDELMGCLFTDFEDYAVQVNKQALEHLSTIQEKALKELGKYVVVVDSRNESCYADILTKLNDIQTTMGQTATIIENILLNDLEVPITQKLATLNEDMIGYHKEQVDAENDILDFMQVLLQAVDKFQKIAINQKKMVSLNSTVQNKVQELNVIFKEKMKTFRENIQSQFKHFQTANSEAKLAVTQIKQNVDTDKRQSLEQLHESLETINRDMTETLNHQLRLSTQKCAQLREEIVESAQHICGSELESINTFCEKMKLTTNLAEKNLSSLYNAGTLCTTNALKVLNDTNIRVGEVTQECREKSRHMLDQVQIFTGTELNLPTHVGDTPQKSQFRPSLLSQGNHIGISADLENIDPNIQGKLSFG